MDNLHNKLITEWEYGEEVRVGLVFPNWAPCPLRGNGCPENETRKRERKLLRHYCSNNPSIYSCEIYQRLYPGHFDETFCPGPKEK